MLDFGLRLDYNWVTFDEGLVKNMDYDEVDEALEAFEDRVFNEVSRRLDVFQEKIEQELFALESDFDDRIMRLEGIARISKK